MISNRERAIERSHCGYCNDTGVACFPNGPDDCDMDFCQCEWGHAAEECAEELAIRMA